MDPLFPYAPPMPGQLALDTDTKGDTVKHTPGAVRAATIIMGDDEYIFTTYGRKSLEGLTELIDGETHGLEMVDALRGILNWVDPESTSSAVVYTNARLLLAKATGGQQ